MAKFERLEPRADDMPLYDGSIDEDEGEEGSRLPLLIVIALLVLAAFAGVVWLAYTQGVERGRADAPRVIVAQGGSGAKLKVYQQPAPSDDGSSDADSVPPPPTPIDKAPAAQTPPDAGPAASDASKSASVPANTASSNPLPAPSQKVVTATPPPARTPPVQPQVATHAPEPLMTQNTSALSTPSALVPHATETPSAPPPAKPEATEETAKPTPTGSYLLQIGAYKSEAEAQSAWHAFQAKHPVVGGYQSDIKQVDLGEKGTWFRLRIGSFADKDAASALCTKLKADGASCLIAK
jgi:cell division septation protein DedD